MRQSEGVFVVLAMTAVLSSCQMISHMNQITGCFKCGDDDSPKCTDKMSLSLSNMNIDILCANIGSCLKFVGSAILLPGMMGFLLFVAYLTNV